MCEKKNIYPVGPNNFQKLFQVGFVKKNFDNRKKIRNNFIWLSATKKFQV